MSARSGTLRKGALVLIATGLLAGCISLGPDAPDQLFTLTPVASPEAGAARQGVATDALAVMVPAAPQRLNVTRVPVHVSDSSLAYLEDAFWVEKPASLFRNLLAETIQARSNRLVVGGGELEYAAATQLSGQLVDMGYDVASGSVRVRYDATLAMPDGQIRTRRFENSVEGIAPVAASVGPALNQAANAVAVEVADWIATG